MPRLALVIELHHPLPPPGAVAAPHWARATLDDYLPILQALDQFAARPGDASITLAVSPSWTAQADDSTSQRLVKRKFDRQKAKGAVNPELSRFFETRWSPGAVGLLREWNDAGAIDVVPTTATHTWLPSVADDPVIARAQIGLAAADHQRRFERSASGIWPPFLGYAQGLESTMAERGLRFFGVGADAFVRGDFSPPRGALQPLVTPPGVAAFGVVHASSTPAFDANLGYGRDPRYAEPKTAERTAREHARRFLDDWLEWGESEPDDFQGDDESISVVSVSPHDIAGAWPLGGGDRWFARLLEGLAELGARATSLDRHLEREPSGMMGRPGASAGGMLAVRPADSDLFDRCRAAADLLAFALERRRSSRPIERETIKRMVRCLLRAQQVDWSLPHGGGVDPQTGLRRSAEHLARFHELAAALMAGRAEFWSPPPERGPAFLPDIDLEILAGG